MLFTRALEEKVRISSLVLKSECEEHSMQRYTNDELEDMLLACGIAEAMDEPLNEFFENAS